MISANAIDSCGIKNRKRKRKTQMNSPSFLCEDQCSEGFAMVTNLQTFWYNARWFAIDTLSPDVLAHRSKALKKPKPEVSSSDSRLSSSKSTEWDSDILFNHHFLNHAPSYPHVISSTMNSRSWVWVVKVICRRILLSSVIIRPVSSSYLHYQVLMREGYYQCYTICQASQF